MRDIVISAFCRDARWRATAQEIADRLRTLLQALVGGSQYSYVSPHSMQIRPHAAMHSIPQFALPEPARPVGLLKHAGFDAAFNPFS